MPNIVDAPLPLGEVIMRLFRAARLSSTRVARHFLLELLRQEKLSALLRVPTLNDVEMQVPASYWKDLTFEAFATAAYRGRRGGSFTVALTDMSDEMAKLVERLWADQSASGRHNLLSSLISDNYNDPEAYVRQSALDEWLLSSGYPVADQYVPQKKGRGRPASDREYFYRGVCRVLMREYMQLGGNIKLLSLATDARQEAKTLAGPHHEIPEAETLKKDLSDLFD